MKTEVGNLNLNKKQIDESSNGACYSRVMFSPKNSNYFESKFNNNLVNALFPQSMSISTYLESNSKTLEISDFFLFSLAYF